MLINASVSPDDIPRKGIRFFPHSYYLPDVISELRISDEHQEGLNEICSYDLFTSDFDAGNRERPAWETARISAPGTNERG